MKRCALFGHRRGGSHPKSNGTDALSLIFYVEESKRTCLELASINRLICKIRPVCLNVLGTRYFGFPLYSVRKDSSSTLPEAGKA
jgi:hypothetical protein